MKRVLYLGTDPSHFEGQGNVIHYPVIKVIPRMLTHPEIQSAFAAFEEYTHLIFTSKNTVEIFCKHLTTLSKRLENCTAKTVIAIGKVTAAHLLSHGIVPKWTAEEETQEGIVSMLKESDMRGAYVFFPRSSLSRPILTDFFKEKKVRYRTCDLYDTVTHSLNPKPDLNQIDEIVFTSPSTVKAFLEVFGEFPKGKKLLAIGPVTQEALNSV